MNLEELERLAREATPGPWSRHRHSETSVIGPDKWVIAACGGHANNQRDPDEIHRELVANAAYIAACSPETVLRLVSIAKAAERDAKDAERYRWLRDKALSAPEPCPWVVYGSDGNNADLIYGAELDAAIDAALIPQ